MTQARVHAAPTFQPLYLQIRALLERNLAAGEWKPGEPIPPEAALASRYGVALGTVRKAILSLAAENFVVRRQGKGTFVATHTEERRSDFRFLRIRADDGSDEHPVSRMVDLRRLRAGSEVARLLELKPGAAVFVLRRVLEYGGVPAVLDEITLPAAAFRGMTRERCSAHHGSMYAFFETEFGVTMLNATERLRAVAADTASAALLAVRPGTPLLAVDRVTRTYGNRPVEFRRGMCATLRHHYWNALS
jgi:GntR family transcriptional regulator